MVGDGAPPYDAGVSPAPALTPADLVGPDARPRPLRVLDRVSDGLGRPAHGPPVPVRHLAFLSRVVGPGTLTFLDGEAFAPALAGLTGCAVVTTAALAGLVPDGNAVVVAPDGMRPRHEFYVIVAELVRAGAFETLAGHVDPDARVHPSAVIGPAVWIDAGAEVGPGAVLTGPTYVGPEVRIKPNAVIGTDGFEVALLGGRRRILPHGGGVWLGRDVEVGAGACIDRGVFGEFTHAGPETKIDNLVHVAHAVDIGASCSIVAGAALNGSSVIGDHAWIAPNATVRQGVRVGSGCLVSMGAVVHKDLPDHTQAVGNPMRVTGHVCTCRAGLRFDDSGRTTCPSCGTAYERLADGGARRLAP